MPTTINGTGITFPNGTTQTTAASGAGTVTSVATGNGLSGGTITTSGTLTVACPTFNTVGSYAGCTIGLDNQSGTIGAGSNYATGYGTNLQVTNGGTVDYRDGGIGTNRGFNISGTWKWMGGSAPTNYGGGYWLSGLACRVS